MTMNPKHQLFSLFAVVVFTVLAVTPVSGDSTSDETIADWVAGKMRFSQAYDMPVRHYVDKKTLGQTWERANREAYYRWEEDYGRDKAKELFEDYMNQIVGLFHEKTEIIYVGNFMEPCAREAIFAHEMAHYFQHLADGVIPHGIYGEEMMRAMREMQAYNIESQYRSEFCGQAEVAGNAGDVDNTVKNNS